MAIENMNGQFFGGKQITVQYAFKKDGKGERHGTQAERLLAAQARSANQDFPDGKADTGVGNKRSSPVEDQHSPIKVCTILSFSILFTHAK